MTLDESDSSQLSFQLDHPTRVLPAVASGMVHDKQYIRQLARSRRDALAPTVRTALSARICLRAWGVLCGLSPARVALYASTGSEVNTDNLFTQLSERNIPVLFPRCAPSGKRLEFAPVGALDELRRGRHQILEPTQEAEPLRAQDVVVLPGLAFDCSGGRLGYGAGYYDRALANFSGVRLGLAFDCQILPKLPRASHDQPVHQVITESRVITCQEDACPS